MRPNQKRIYLGADHAGFALKERIKKWLKARKIPYQDLGNTIYDQHDDYPDFAAKVARTVAKINGIAKNNGKGILVCGSAQGMCIAANKIKGIRAVVPFSLQETRLSRQHNDANVLCLSGWFMNEKAALKMIRAFLATPFSRASRHQIRIQKIRKLEGGR